MFKKIFYVSVYFAVTCSLSYALSRHVQGLRASAPPPAPPTTERYSFHFCYPSTYQAPSEVRSVTSDGAQYWEMRAKSQNLRKPVVRSLYFEVSGKGCEWLNRKVQDNPVSRQSYMSKDASEALSRLIFEPMFDRCEKDSKIVSKKEARKFCGRAIAQKLSGTAFEKRILHPEDVDVLNRMGVPFGRIKNVETTEIFKK